MIDIIQEFHGFSGSKIFKINKDNKFVVRKINNIQRNIERYEILKNYNISMPEILFVGENYYDMECIDAINIVTFINNYDIDLLLNFLKDTFATLKQNGIDKNYIKTYEEKLNFQDWNDVPFNKCELIKKLPEVISQTLYHGDLTLDNILYDIKMGKFFLIDPLTSVYDSYIFDLAKLNQDLICGWFSKNNTNKHKVKIDYLFKKLSETYPELNNKYVLILMLFRIFPYCNDTQNKTFLLKWINKLWT